MARKTGRAELDEHAMGVNASEIEAPFELEGRSREEFLSDVRDRLEHLSGVSIEVGQTISHRIDAMPLGTKAVSPSRCSATTSTGSSPSVTILKRHQGIDGIADLNVEQQVERSQLFIRPRREMLAMHGITMPEFSEFVGTALSGQVRLAGL